MLTNRSTLLLFVIGIWLVSGVLGQSENQEVLNATCNVSNTVCNKGQAYWCKNLTSSMECCAFEHCKQAVWLPRKCLEKDNTPVCQICLDMVQQARDVLDSNSTEQQIREVFNGSCALLMVPPIVQECDKIADQYISQLMDILKEQMNPQMVCSLCGLCSCDVSSNPKIISSKLAINACEKCRTVGRVIESKIAAINDEEWMDMLLMVCRGASTFSELCSQTVSNNSTWILKNLRNSLNANSMCELSGQCSELFHMHNVEVVQESQIGYVQRTEVSDEMVCDFCEQLVDHFKGVIINNTTETEFQEEMKVVCKQLGNYADQCDDLVSEYSDELFEYLSKELDGKTACKIIGLCSKPNTVLTNSIDELSPEMAQLPLELYTPPHMVNTLKSNMCVFCKMFLHYLQNEITQNITEKKLKNIFDEFCTNMKQWQNLCKSVVNQYEPILIALIEEKTDPSMCLRLDMCPSSSFTSDTSKIASVSDSKCTLCILAVADLEEVIKENKTKEYIKNAVDNVCNHLSHYLHTECVDFVNVYGDCIVDMLLANYTAQELCAFMKVCKTGGVSEIKAQQLDNTGGDIDTNMIPDITVNGRLNGLQSTNMQYDDNNEEVCSICEVMISEIQTTLKNNATEEQIKDDLIAVCNISPHGMRNTCVDYVNKYFDAIVQMLIEAFKPRELCELLSLCKANNNINDFHQPDFHSLTVVCKTSSLDSTKCTMYFGYFMERLSRLLSTRIVSDACQIGRFSNIRKEASAKKRQPELLGSNHCTFGPTYWCTNRTTANACNALDYCKKLWVSTSN